jgi:hypothetical protein
VSGEESGEQVALRARRLGLDTRGLQLMAEINLERILSTLQAEMPTVAVIDSIQTLWSDQLSSARLGGPGARVRGTIDAPGQAGRHHGDPGRPCDQGRRLAGRACSNTLSIPCFISRATPIPASAWCVPSRTASARSMSWASSP